MAAPSSSGAVGGSAFGTVLFVRWVEVLLRASLFGLVLSQYTFGGSLLPFIYTYALAYAVYALTTPAVRVVMRRFSARALVLGGAMLIVLFYAVLSVVEALGLTNVWLTGVFIPPLVAATVLVYRTLQERRPIVLNPLIDLLGPLVGDGLEGLAPEILAGVVLILFGRPGILALAVVAAVLALFAVGFVPRGQGTRAEGTGATFGQMLSDINNGLSIIFQNQRLATLQLAATGANFFLSVISGLLFPLSLLRGGGAPGVFLWIQGGAVVGLLVGLRLLRDYRKQTTHSSVFFVGFIASGLLSLALVGLTAPVPVWAAAYSVLQIASVAAISPFFNASRARIPPAERAAANITADLVSFSVNMIGIATAGIVIERMLIPALAPGGVLEPWLTPWVGSGPEAPIAAYWVIGGLALAVIGAIAWWIYLRLPEERTPLHPLTDEGLLSTPEILLHRPMRLAIGVGAGLVVSVLIAIGLAQRLGELYPMALSLVAVVAVLVGSLLLLGWPKARPGAADTGLTFTLLGLSLSALTAGGGAELIAALALPIVATRLPRLTWAPTAGLPAPPYLAGVMRAIAHFGLLVSSVNLIALLGPSPAHGLSVWLTTLTVLIGGSVYIGGTLLRFQATHRSALRTQLGLLFGAGAMPLIPLVLGAILLAFVLPDLLTTAPGWVAAATLLMLLTPAAFGFVFWNPPGRVLRLERRLAPLLWIGVVATLYVFSSVALRGWGAPWAVDIALAIGAMILVVVGLREWASPLARGRASALERELLRRPTLEAIDQALVDLCEYLGAPGLILAHEQPGRPGWTIRRALETETLQLDEAALPATPPADCLVADAGRREGWLAPTWVAVAQPIRLEDQMPLGCLLLPQRGRPYTSADLKRAAEVADALAAPMQVIALRWAALKPYREREQAQREERTRIARRLHAEVLQSLAPLPGYLAIAAQRSPDESLREMLARQEQEVIKVDDAIRQVVTAIRPASLNAPLALLMEQALRRAATESPETQFHSDIQVPREFDLPAEAKWPVHNIVDNALSNARKHAQAKNIWLTLRREGLHLALVVEDDGVGIPLKEGETDALSLIRNGHFGLADMLDDAEQLNGRLALGRRMAGGTYVRLWFPVPE